MNKTKKQAKKKTPSPRLSTILMVEDTLKNMDYSMIKVSELKRILPKKVNHNTLISILDYLQRDNKIYYNFKGITWIKNDSPQMTKTLKSAHFI